MKAQIYTIEGKEKKQTELPKIFEIKIREDIVSKTYEAEKLLYTQPYAPDPKAGKKHSASGTISHKRHDWKGHYGHGTSRAPRKTMWRRGTQFYWVGAEVSSARGGREAHPPKIYKKLRKINKNELKIAINSAIAATANKNFLLKRYSSINSFDQNLPIILESSKEIRKIKSLNIFLREILGKYFQLAIKTKTTRSGKGKRRGRRYKSNAGILLVKAKDETIQIKSIDTKSVSNLMVADLYPLGRLTVFTEKAIEELRGKK